MKQVQIPLLILLLWLLCSCTGSKDLNRQLELLEIERTQLLKQQRLINVNNSSGGIFPNSMPGPYQDFQLLPLPTRTMKPDETHLLEDLLIKE